MPFCTARYAECRRQIAYLAVLRVLGSDGRQKIITFWHPRTEISYVTLLTVLAVNVEVTDRL
jgi:hypothetical protein